MFKFCQENKRFFLTLSLIFINTSALMGSVFLCLKYIPDANRLKYTCPVSIGFSNGEINPVLNTADCWVQTANQTLPESKLFREFFSLAHLPPKACQIVCNTAEQLNLSAPKLSFLLADEIKFMGIFSSFLLLGITVAISAFGIFALNLIYPKLELKKENQTPPQVPDVHTPLLASVRRLEPVRVLPFSINSSV